MAISGPLWTTWFHLQRPSESFHGLERASSFELGVFHSVCAHVGPTPHLRNEWPVKHPGLEFWGKSGWGGQRMSCSACSSCLKARPINRPGKCHSLEFDECVFFGGYLFFGFKGRPKGNCSILKIQTLEKAYPGLPLSYSALRALNCQEKRTQDDLKRLTILMAKKRRHWDASETPALDATSILGTAQGLILLLLLLTTFHLLKIFLYFP